MSYISQCNTYEYTVGENIIATIKMRNNFCYPLKMVILPKIAIAILNFFYCSPFSYRSSNFALAKVVALNLLNFCMSFVDWFMASSLFCFPYSYRSSNYCNSNGSRSFTLLKALTKSNSTLFAIGFQRGLRVITLQGAIEKSLILLLQYWKFE